MPDDEPKTHPEPERGDGGGRRPPKTKLGYDESSGKPEHYSYSDDALEALLNAANESRALRHGYLGTEHVVVGLIAAPGNAGARLRAHGASVARARSVLQGLILPSEKELPDELPKSTWLRLALTRANELSQSSDTPIQTEHLLFGVLNSGGEGVTVIRMVGIDVELLAKQLEHYLFDGDPKRHEASLLDRTDDGFRWA